MLLISPKYVAWWTQPPIGLGWIASALERVGIKPKIIDCQITRDYKRKIAESLRQYPTVGISVTIGTISSALDIASFIRKSSPGTRIIFGGPHPTAIYEKLIPKYADIVVLGEGEDTVVELMQQRDLSQIKGIAYWDDFLKVNPRRPFIEDLDRLGFPAWHLFDLKAYRFIDSRIPFAVIATSRGCPYQCIYCTKFIHGSTIRLRSIENVLKEIDYLVNILKIREIRFADDNFTFYPERVKQFCKALLERDYRNIRFNLSGGIRPDICDQEMFELLSKAGFYWISLAIDSGLPFILDKLKRNLDLEMVSKTINIINKTKMKVRLNFILGLPFDTVETMKQTIDLAKGLLVHNQSVLMVSLLIAIPFPGTEFYQLVEEKGKFLCDLTLNSVIYNRKAVYEMDNLKAKDVNKMYCQAHKRLFFNPSYILRIMKLKPGSIQALPRAIKFVVDKLFLGGKIS